MFQQPSKLLKFVAAIVLVLPNSLALLAEPCHGCCRLAWTPTPCGPMPLEQFQMDEINAQKDFIAQLSANKTKTYLNQEPIVTRFTPDQMARIMDVYGGFGRNRPVYEDMEDLLWEEPANISTTSLPRRKRRNAAVTGQRICQVDNIMQPLITAFRTNDDTLQIVQFDGFEQWVLRQECRMSLSDEGTLSRLNLQSMVEQVDIACQTIQRSVYLVAIRLDGEGPGLGDIAVQEVQVESCSSFV